MAGLFLVGVILLWLLVSAKAAVVVSRRLHGSATRWSVGLLLFAALVFLPVIDEVVGGFQFHALCARSEFHKGVPNLQGRTARFEGKRADEPNTAIRIIHSFVRYVDVQSGDLILSFDTYIAKGGLLVRALGMSESSAPLILGKSSCSPEDAQHRAAPSTFNFKAIN